MCVRGKNIYVNSNIQFEWKIPSMIKVLCVRQYKGL